jgi:hypothetical protein
MSIKLVFQDGKGHTLHEKDFTHEGSATVIPGQGHPVQIPGGEQLKVMSRRFVYPDSEHGQTDVQVIFVCKTEKKHTVSKTPLKGF